MEHTRILESALREFNLRYEEEEEHIIKFASHSRLSYFKKFHNSAFLDTSFYKIQVNMYIGIIYVYLL